ncbi:MAG: tetratricopeptide repeat protein, partial [Desulfobacterales bacterium]
ALEYLSKAGDKFAAAFANQEALDYYAQAQEACGKLGASWLATSVDLAKRRGLVNVRIGDFLSAIADFDSMLVSALNLADRHQEAIALAYRGWAELRNHDPQTAEGTLRSALALAEEGLEDVRFFASLGLGAACLVYNRHAEGEPFFRVAEKLAPKADDLFVLGWWGLYGSLWPHWQGRFDDALKVQADLHGSFSKGGVAFLMNSWVEAMARGGKGDYEQALTLLEEVIADSKRIGDIWFLARTLNTIGWLYSELQDHGQAMAWNERGVEAVRAATFPDPEIENNSRLNLGDNLLALGRLDEAEDHFQKVEQVVRNPRPQDKYMLWRYSQRLFHSYGEVWLDRNKLDKAKAYADECLALAEQSRSQKNIVKARRLRGEIFLERGKLQEAGQELSIALKVAQSVGNPTQLWKTYMVQGDLCEAQGQPDDAWQTYRDALAVIEKVAAGLKNKSLRETFITSKHVQEVRQKAQRDN